MRGTESYSTRGGIRVHRTVTEIPVANAIEPVIAALDAHRGVLLASSYEYPGRYTRWDMGFVDPPLALTARERRVRVEALNERGRRPARRDRSGPARARGHRRRRARRRCARGHGASAAGGRFAEEERSRQPSVFSVAPRPHRSVRPRRRAAPRPLRRLRLRPGLPVRAHSPAARAPGRPARPRALPARRAGDRRPPPRGRAAPPLRVRGRPALDRRAAARGRGASLRRRGRASRRGRRPCAGRVRRDRAPRAGVVQARRPLRGRARPDVLRAVPGAALRAVPPPARAQPLAVRLPHQPRRGGVPGRRVAGDVRAGRRRPRRDVPDLRHDRARHATRSATPPRSWRC